MGYSCRQNDSMRYQLEQYLRALHADLDVEIDLHGSRTDMARNIRLAIIATELELQELGAV